MWLAVIAVLIGLAILVWSAKLPHWSRHFRTGHVSAGNGGIGTGSIRRQP